MIVSDLFALAALADIVVIGLPGACLATWVSLSIISFCIPFAVPFTLSIILCFSVLKEYFTLMSVRILRSKSIASVFKSFAMSLNVAVELICEIGIDPPVISSCKLLTTDLNHSNASLTKLIKEVVGLVSYSFLKCLARAWVTISISLSSLLKRWLEL